MLTNNWLKGDEEDRYSVIGNVRVNYTHEEVYSQGAYLVVLVFLKCRISSVQCVTLITKRCRVSSVCYSWVMGHQYTDIPVLCSFVICDYIGPVVSTSRTASLSRARPILPQTFGVSTHSNLALVSFDLRRDHQFNGPHDGHRECGFHVLHTAISWRVCPVVPSNSCDHLLSKVGTSDQASTVDWWLSRSSTGGVEQNGS